MVMGVCHDSCHHHQVLADLWGGSEDVAVPQFVCDAAVLLHESVDVFPHHEFGLAGECLQRWAELGNVVQFSQNGLQLSQAVV